MKNTLRPRRHILAVVISTCLCFNATAAEPAANDAASTDVSCDAGADPATRANNDACRDNATPETRKRGMGATTGWILGGLGVAGLAAAGGGGGGGSGGSGGGGGGGGGITPGPSPGQEGGRYGDGSQLSSAGQTVNWGSNGTTEVTGRNVRNNGAVQVGTGQLLVRGNLTNQGTLDIAAPATLTLTGEGELRNHGTMTLAGALTMNGDSDLENYQRFEANGARINLSREASIENAAHMSLSRTTVALSGEAEFDNGERGANARLVLDDTRFTLREGAEFENRGAVEARGLAQGQTLFDIQSSRVAGENDRRIEAFDNYGSIRLEGAGRVLDLSGSNIEALGINRLGGHITSLAANDAMIRASGTQAVFVNQGTLTALGDNAVAMQGVQGATLINDGVINLGLAGQQNGSGMVAMQSDGSAHLNNRRGGVINIHANDSHAFQSANGSGRLINNGQVNVYGQGSAVYMPGTQATGGADLTYQAPRISGYTIGTNADGSAGQLSLHNGGQIDEMQVDSGFARGTDAQHVVLHNVVLGADGGEQNIRSQSVVWRAQAQRDENGAIDVAMSKNAYADLADESLRSLASALDRSYTNNALFHSLEASSTAAFQQALNRLSGSELRLGTQQALGEGRQFWSRLAPVSARAGFSMLGFGGESRLGGGAPMVGSAMQVGKMLGGGVLSLRGGLTEAAPAFSGTGEASRSQYMGLAWTAPLAMNLDLRQSVNSERHDVSTARRVGLRQDTRALSERSIARQEWRGEIGHFLARGPLSLQSSLGARAYQQHESAFQERGGSAFALGMGAVDSRGLDVVAGLQGQWRLRSGWSMDAQVELSDALAYRESTRWGSLAGAPGEVFALPASSADGLASQLSLGLRYAGEATRVDFSAQSLKAFGQRDQRLDMRFHRAF